MSTDKKLVVYFSHAMTGMSREQSRERADYFKECLPDVEVLIPEDWQVGTPRDSLMEMDLEAIRKSDMVIVDTLVIGHKIVKDGITITIMGRGVWFEAGYAYALGKPIVQVGSDNHPFTKCASVVVDDLAGLLAYIKLHVLKQYTGYGWD